MTRLISASLLLALCAGCGSSSPLAVSGDSAGAEATDTGVINVSNTPDFGEGEESLSVNPANPLDIVVGSNQIQPVYVGPVVTVPVSTEGLMTSTVWVSHDGGLTWSGVNLDRGGFTDIANPLSALLPGVPSEFRDVGNILDADQHSAWDRHGNLYYESGQLGDPAGNGDQRARVWRSIDGGRTWSEPVVAFSDLNSPEPIGSIYPVQTPTLDRPWLAIDNSGGPRDGTVYLTFETGPFSEGTPPEIYLTSSTDHGATWLRSRRIDDGLYATQNNPRQFPVVGADGALYVIYDKAPPTVTVTPLPQIGTIQLALVRSTDGGEHFDRFTVDGDVHRVTSPDEALPFYTETIPALAADPAHAGHLAAAWPEKLSMTNSRIMLRTSNDGGATWSPRIDVADDPAATDNEHDHPALAFTPEGQLIVMWRDRRCCGGTFSSSFQMWARIVSVVDDGQAQLGKVIEFTQGRQEPTTTKRGGVLVPSEFIGLAANSYAVFASWDQVSGALSDNVYRRLPLSAFAAD